MAPPPGASGPGATWRRSSGSSSRCTGWCSSPATAPTPKLGIDLQGGTRVTLTARTETGGEPPPRPAQRWRGDHRAARRTGSVSAAPRSCRTATTSPSRCRARRATRRARSARRPSCGSARSSAAGRRRPPPPGRPRRPGPGARRPATPVHRSPTGAPPARPRPPAPARRGGPRGQQPVAPVGLARPCRRRRPPHPRPHPPRAPVPRRPRRIRPTRAWPPRRSTRPEPTRQSTDPAVQAQALQALDCAVEDPLRGYDDPTRPLVACDRDGTEKYVLGPAFLSGTADRQRAGRTRTPRAPAGSSTCRSRADGAAIWARLHRRRTSASAWPFVLDSQVVSAPDHPGPDLGNTADHRQLQPGGGHRPRQRAALRLAAAVVRHVRGADGVGDARAGVAGGRADRRRSSASRWCSSTACSTTARSAC